MNCLSLCLLPVLPSQMAYFSISIEKNHLSSFLSYRLETLNFYYPISFIQYFQNTSKNSYCVSSWWCFFICLYPPNSSPPSSYELPCLHPWGMEIASRLRVSQFYFLLQNPLDCKSPKSQESAYWFVFLQHCISHIDDSQMTLKLKHHRCFEHGSQTWSKCLPRDYKLFSWKILWLYDM